MMASDFVSRLQGVKSKGRDKWMACCPAHDDKDPSLSVAVTPGGKILLKCWTGCSALEIVHAMGLNLHDLFEKPLDYEPPMAFAQREMKERAQRQSRINRERMVLALAQADRRAGKTLTQTDLHRERQAFLYLTQQGVEATPWVVHEAVKAGF